MKPNQAKTSTKASIRWFDYIFVFIVIFASLYLTFQLKDYNEYLNNRKKEEVYLARLYEDFNKDIEQLQRRIKIYDEKIKNIDKLKSLLNNYEANQDSIKILYNQYLDYTFLYNPVNNTFEYLKTGGDLKLIENEKFKVLLSELDKSYKSVINAGQILEDFREGAIWNNLFIEYIDLETFDKISSDPSLNIKFKNLVTIYSKHSVTYFLFLQGTLKKTIEAKELLETELSSRNISYQKDELDDELEELLPDL